MKFQMIRAVALSVITAVMAHALATAPTASLARMSGSDITNASGTLLVVIDNPVNSSGTISRIEIAMGSFGTPTSATVEAGGTSGTATAGTTTTVVLTSPLRAGLSAYVKLSGVANPASAGTKAVTVTAFDAQGNAAVLSPKSGKSLSRTIIVGGFRSTPYGRVGVNWGTGAAATGLKVATLANVQYAYIIYNPVDSGASINHVQLTIPKEYVLAVGAIGISNITVGTNCTKANTATVASATGIEKFFVITNIDNPIRPGEVGFLYITAVTSPPLGGSYTWKMSVRDTNDSSGTLVQLADMPGFTSPQTVTIAANPPAAGTYGDVQPWFDLGNNTGPGTMGWPTVGLSNNTYQFVFYKTTAWAVVADNPLKISNLSFDFSQSAVARSQVNGAGFGGGNKEAYGYSNTITAAGAVNNAGIVVMSNVINPSSAGSFTFNLTAAGVNVANTISGVYTRIVDIRESLFSTKPAFGVLVAGSTATNASGKYYFVVANPLNSGDAVDRVRVAIPSGFTVTSTASEISAGIMAGNSSMVASASVSTAVVDVVFTTPLGQGATAFIPVTLVNPANAGSFIFSATVSGQRDGNALTPSTSFPDDANIEASTTVLIGTTAASAVQNVDIVGYPNPLRSGNLTVSFTLLYPSTVTVALYDAKNRRVATLANNVPYQSGSSAVVWDGKSIAGNEVKNGIYYVKVSATPTGAGTGFTKVYKVSVQK